MARGLATMGVVIAAALALAFPAQALPSFGRREGVSCATCHSSVPRLNRTGYDYQNAGYRMPDKIGEDQTPKEFGHFNTGRFDTVASWLRTDDGSKVTNQAVINSLGATLYPATGAFGNYWSSRVEVGLSPGSGATISNAFVRGTFGGETQHVNVRLGIVHPWEGYGASDQPVGLTSPLFQVMPAQDLASGSASSMFAPQSFNQAVLELGYTIQGFNIAASVLNGIKVTGNPDGSLSADPNIGGSLVRDAGDPNFNRKDFQVYANQFIGDAAVSAYYYHGTVSLPVPGATTPATGTSKFDRVALYGTLPLPVYKKLSLEGGFQYGWDDKVGPAPRVTSSDRFASAGWFGQLYYHYNAYLGAIARYDAFDPSRSTSNEGTKAFTLAMNGSILNGLQGIIEYRYVNSQTGLNQPNATSHGVAFQATFLY